MPLVEAVSLTPGFNSFDTLEGVKEKLRAMPTLTLLASLSDEQLQPALEAAYHNIAKLTIRLEQEMIAEGNVPDLPSSPLNDALKSRYGRFEEFGETDATSSLTDVNSSEDLDLGLLARMKEKAFRKFVRAQLVEANSILGGNPVEDRRRAGLISDSAGESTHFFRTSKPLELPVYRATINEMKGVVVWKLSIGR